MNRIAVCIPRVRARLACACLAGMAAVHLAYLWWAWELSQRVDELGRHPDAVADIMDHAQLLTALDQMHAAGLGITALAFLMWFHQVRENVRTLRPDVHMPSSGLMLWGFFVPVINWVLPYILVVDVWKESQPKRDYVPGAPERSLAIHAWGVGWVAMWVAFASLRGARGIERVESMDVTVTAVGTLSGVCAITAILAVFMVRAVTARQAGNTCAATARVVNDGLTIR